MRGGQPGGETGIADGVRTLKLTLAYDGTHYVGWQRQAEGDSIQEVLEEALSRFEEAPVTVHGAGRTMSRTKAAGKKRGGKRTGGDVSREMMENWVRKKNVVLRGAGTDESPHCYKRLPEVLEQHAGTIRILQTLTPIGVAMAGADEFDPYKD